MASAIDVCNHFKANICVSVFPMKYVNADRGSCMLFLLLSLKLLTSFCLQPCVQIWLPLSSPVSFCFNCAGFMTRDAAGCMHYHVAQFSLSFWWLRADHLLDLALLGVPFVCCRVRFKTYSFCYSKVLLLFTVRSSTSSSTRLVVGLIGGDVIAYIDGVVIGCWVRVGFRLWFGYM